MCYFGKTMLSCYNSIDKVVEQIDNVIKAKVKNSFYSYSSTYSLAEKILALTEVKKDLLELKYITSETLLKLSEYDRTLLCYKYLKVKPSDENFDLTSRNYFRKQIKAIEKFNKKLSLFGFDEAWFKTKYLKIAFINGVYNKIIN